MLETIARWLGVTLSDIGYAIFELGGSLELYADKRYWEREGN